MTAPDHASYLLKLFSTVEDAAAHVDEMITADVKWVSYINDRYYKDFGYYSHYWQEVKKELYDESKLVVVL